MDDQHLDAPEGDDEPVDEVAHLLERERFSQARFDIGYIRPDVDAMLADLRVSYESGDGIAGIVERHTLRTSGFREGYEVSEVEGWITRLSEAAETPIGERPASTPAETGVRPKRPPRNDPAITEQRGLFGRLRRQR